MGEPMPILAAVEGYLDLIDSIATQPRHPVIRLGKREPIQPIVRAIVFQRDNHTCQGCGSRPMRSMRVQHAVMYGRDHLCSWCDPALENGLELDHIVPWSAGGSDRSDNLRSLCSRCNSDRSNFRGGLDDARRPLGVTPICVPCIVLKYGCPGRLLDPYHPTAGPDAIHTPEEDRTTVYCGTCHMTSWTHAEDIL